MKAALLGAMVIVVVEMDGRTRIECTEKSPQSESKRESSQEIQKVFLKQTSTDDGTYNEEI